ncbi:MAG: hypothetical protein U9Q81_12030 [Pseudomonadota bacterium]|nr:hypothetical protein [Pseudomonadota bacterium]
MNSIIDFDQSTDPSQARAEFEATLQAFAARTADEMRVVNEEAGADAAARHGQLVLAQWVVALLDTGELERWEIEAATRRVLDLIAEKMNVQPPAALH